MSAGGQRLLGQTLAAGATGCSRRSFVTSSSTGAPAGAAAPGVSGDVAGVLAGIEAVVSGDAVTPKDIADAAMSLTFLKAKGDRRLWGKVFQAASSSAGSFDAPALASFLWAVNTANVGHFKTLYDLAGPAAKVLAHATPAQQALIIEALGKAGVNDPDLYKTVAAGVGKASYSAGEVSKLLAGAAAAGVAEPALVKAAGGVLTAKAADASAKDLAQAVWAYAKLGRSDPAVLDALSKALSVKLGTADATAQDAVAALWGFANLNHKPDTQTLAKASNLIKSGAGELSVEAAVWATWSMALLQQFDKDVLTSLFSGIGKAVSSAPDSLTPKVLAALFEAQTLTLDRMGAQGPKLPDQVYHYSQDMYRLVLEASRNKSGSGSGFRNEVATAAAKALGARYKPEIATEAAKMSGGSTPDGLPIELQATLDDKTKFALVTAEGLSAGHVESARRILDSRGFKVAAVDRAVFEAQPDDKAKAKYILSALKAAAPGAASKLNALEKKLDTPFDPYAE